MVYWRPMLDVLVFSYFLALVKCVCGSTSKWNLIMVKISPKFQPYKPDGTTIAYAKTWFQKEVIYFYICKLASLPCLLLRMVGGDSSVSFLEKKSNVPVFFKKKMKKHQIFHLQPICSILFLCEKFLVYRLKPHKSPSSRL